MANVVWEPFKGGLPETTDADLDLLESERGLSLPRDYRALVKSHRGDVPVPGNIQVGRREISINSLFFVEKDYAGENRSDNSWSYIDDFDAELPPDVSRTLMPFISDSGHYIFVFDYRGGEVPAVAMVDTQLDFGEGENAIRPVADSLQGFIDDLHPD